VNWRQFPQLARAALLAVAGRSRPAATHRWASSPPAGDEAFRPAVRWPPPRWVQEVVPGPARDALSARRLERQHRLRGTGLDYEPTALDPAWRSRRTGQGGPAPRFARGPGVLVPAPAGERPAIPAFRPSRAPAGKGAVAANDPAPAVEPLALRRTERHARCGRCARAGGGVSALILAVSPPAVKDLFRMKRRCRPSAWRAYRPAAARGAAPPVADACSRWCPRVVSRGAFSSPRRRLPAHDGHCRTLRRDSLRRPNDQYLRWAAVEGPSAHGEPEGRPPFCRSAARHPLGPRPTAIVSQRWPGDATQRAVPVWRTTSASAGPG